MGCFANNDDDDDEDEETCRHGMAHTSCNECLTATVSHIL
jgi:hypothetical protein